MAIVDRVRDLVDPDHRWPNAGVELYDVEHNGGVLRIFVDDPTGVLRGTLRRIDIDVQASSAVAISRLLDEADPSPGQYTLEVSSPGPRVGPCAPSPAFEKAVGADVKAKTRPDAATVTVDA